MPHALGYIRDHIDPRDYQRFATTHEVQTAPPVADLRAQMPPVYDQMALGSCVSNGVAAIVEADQIKQGETPVMPSRLFIYYLARVIEHSVKSDSGAQIRDGVKAVATTGFCPETDWPYNIATFTGPPPPSCAKDAATHKAIQYQRVQNTEAQIEATVASGFGVVFGCSVFESFESDAVNKTGIVPMPKRGESMLGGHCMVVVGYNRNTQHYLVRNSWGTGWSAAMGGHCWMPYAYFPKYASDLWVVERVA